LVPVGPDECLFSCQVGENRTFRLGRYKNGNFSLIEPGAGYAWLIRDNATGRIYATDFDQISGIALISEDGGNTWIREPIDPKIVPGYEEGEAFNVYAAHDGVAYFTNGESIVKRRGLPGEGQYKLAFLSNTGPAFHHISDLAVAEDGAVMALGGETCVYGRGDAWVIERMPYSMVFKAITPAPDHGFFAVATNNTFSNRVELLYHP